MSRGWQYPAHPNFSDELLRQRAEAALKLIAGKTNDELMGLMCDTRPVHHGYFDGLTPPNAPYFAGNYRGAPFDLLRHYGVQVNGMAGVSPLVVARAMEVLAEEADRLFQRYEVAVASSAALTVSQKLYRLAEISAGLFVAFLTIHPYADGNGHMSRMIIHMCFSRYGYINLDIPIHPRPEPPIPLPDLIMAYQGGNHAPLVTYLLSSI